MTGWLLFFSGYVFLSIFLALRPGTYTHGASRRSDPGLDPRTDTWKHYASLPHSHYEPHSISRAADHHFSRAAATPFPTLPSFLPSSYHFIPFISSQIRLNRYEHGGEETAKAANPTKKKSGKAQDLEIPKPHGFLYYYYSQKREPDTNEPSETAGRRGGGGKGGVRTRFASCIVMKGSYRIASGLVHEHEDMYVDRSVTA